MFDKLKASMGIGAAKVDTILTTDVVVQGGTVSGIVKITGGNINQKAEKIVLKLMTLAKEEVDDSTNYGSFCLGQIQISGALEIEANETYEAEFEFALHPDTPITENSAYKNKCSVWIDTEIDIDLAIDPKDKDALKVVPCDTAESIMKIMHSAGYELYKADTEVGHVRGEGFQSTSGCYQELEYKARGSLMAKEVELTFIVNENSIYCVAEKDRMFGGDAYYSFEIAHGASEYQIKEALSMFV